MRRELAETILAAKAERKAAALLIWLESGEQQIVFPESVDEEQPDLAKALTDAFRLDRSGTIETDHGELFIRIFNPPLRVVVIGAVHAAQFLVPIADMIGHDVTIIDPREAFASRERFPTAHLVTEWPDEGLPQVGVDARTAIITLTHDSKIDDIAIKIGLDHGAFYIGALGSKRTHAQRLDRLREMGVTDEGIARVHAPVGLDIGAQGPAEIAVSIMAELVAVLRGKTTLQ